MFKKILVVLALAFAVLCAVIATRPDTFSVSRSALIAAPPSAVFAHVNDLHRWEVWSPWEKLDPQMERTHSGAPSGAGAVYAWKGNHQIGEGRMTITESRPDELLKLRLDFIKPFAGTSDVTFTFTPQGDQTAVTWSISGENNFISKAMSLFMNCDKMMGTQFEQGLAELKAVSEKK